MGGAAGVIADRAPTPVTESPTAPACAMEPIFLKWGILGKNQLPPEPGGLPQRAGLNMEENQLAHKDKDHGVDRQPSGRGTVDAGFVARAVRCHVER